jgi:hypothetical protein
MNDVPRVLIVVLEYSPAQQRVMVRGVWEDGQRLPEPLDPRNVQNHIRVFENVTMGSPTGMTGLVPA